jgi:hypothetical protein
MILAEVFSWLAANFGYPELLDGAAATVLLLMGLVRWPTVPGRWPARDPQRVVRHASDAHRGLSRVGYAVGGLGVVAAFRNVSAVVQPFSDANNFVLPLWLLALGVLLVRTPVAATVPGSTPSNRQ